ncbi:centromere protein S-like isoform X2 [Zootermopsis nevadensis]|uniref:Centromere protein S n=1 Tax=Zootermopsis nevadensis TaxID=136037 RepID=A0A067R7P3_ZOONE|nr:centromere protein S-like isoform X2 [Zootermopsis nevadensis]KDR15492.1 Centromere protein S [Zootermopsis nevadensis]
MEGLSHEEKLRLSVLRDVSKICQEVGGQIKMELEKDVINLIGELIWKKMRVISQDLEHFAKHAKRTTINAEDVKLLTRRNPSLRATVCEMADKAAKKKRQGKEKATEELS